MAIERSKGSLATQRGRPVTILGLVVILALALAACSGSGPSAPAGNPTAAVPSAATAPASGAGSKAAAPAAGATQKSEGGQVTVEVTWPGPSAGPVFEVVMDTHAVDLDGFDLRQLAVLRTDQAREVQPSGWDAPKGGHHRSGKLTFPTTAADGSQVIGPATRTVELVIKDVAGVPERTFRWTPS